MLVPVDGLDDAVAVERDVLSPGPWW
jgi:hypothetical protein